MNPEIGKYYFFYGYEGQGAIIKCEGFDELMSGKAISGCVLDLHDWEFYAPGSILTMRVIREATVEERKLFLLGSVQ